MASADQVKAEVSSEVQDAGFVQRLAERMGTAARASAVFGEPVEQSGLTVIPVAKTSWGFGGGSGGDGANQGSGGGGAGTVTPIGFIEVRAGAARFVPIRDLRMAAVRLAVSAGVVAWAVRRHR